MNKKSRLLSSSLPLLLFVLYCVDASQYSLPSSFSSPTNTRAFEALLSTAHQCDPSSALELAGPDVLAAHQNGNHHEAWKSLLKKAMEENLYSTANSALKLFRDKQSELDFSTLICMGSEEVLMRDGTVGKLSYLQVLPGNEKKTTIPSNSFEYASSSDSCPSAVLTLPNGQYAPPQFKTRRERKLSTFNNHADVINFAKKNVASKLEIENLHLTPISLHEKVSHYKSSWSDGTYLVAFLDHDKEGSILVLYSFNEAHLKTSHVEKQYEVSFQEEDGSSHQVGVAVSHRSNQSPRYSLTKHSSTSSKRDKRSPRGNSITLQVLSFNIWNYNGDWNYRRSLIVDLIKAIGPDIVGFQEIRKKYAGGKSQLEEMATYLPGYNYVYQPAMQYETEEEGVGVLTLYPILEHNYINLAFVPGSPDGNRRVCLRTLLDTPGGNINFFATHFSYAKGAGQMQNALDMWNFMESYRPNNNTWAQIAVGDFNIYPDSVGPTDFLTGRSTHNGIKGDLIDAWERMHESDPGFTFSNLPGKTWSSRADRVLHRGPSLNELMVERRGFRNETKSTAASDHVGVLTRFIMKV